MSILNKKTYLGDGVYGSFDGFNVWLTTENGIQTTNEICLEPEILIRTRAYLSEMIAAIAEARSRQERVDAINDALIQAQNEDGV